MCELSGCSCENWQVVPGILAESLNVQSPISGLRATWGPGTDGVQILSRTPKLLHQNLRVGVEPSSLCFNKPSRRF